MAAAVSCLIVAGLVAGSAAGYALNTADNTRMQQQGKAIPTQVVNSSHTQEQVSVSTRNELENYSWEELATISDAIAVAKSEKEALKIAKDFNLVGPSGKLDGTQTKSIRLESGAVAQAQIIGFAHDVRDGGGKAGITFMFKDCIAEHQLNASNSTGGGWLHSDLRHWMNGELYNGLPEDLRNSIVAVCKSANNEGKTDSRSSVTTVSDLLWAPSFAELVGYVDMDSYEKAYERIPASRESEFQTYFDIWNAEGSQYKLYRDSGTKMAKSSKVLVKSLPSGAAATWWGRSASPGEWDRALSVSSEGKAQKSTSAPSEWLGVAPCFCVGRFGCGEARDTVPDYVDNSVTYVNPVDVRYVYVNEDNSSSINVTYVDKSTTTNNVTNNTTNNVTNNHITNNVTNNETTNNVDNSVNVNPVFDTVVGIIGEDQGGQDPENEENVDPQSDWDFVGQNDDDGDGSEDGGGDAADEDDECADGESEWLDRGTSDANGEDAGDEDANGEDADQEDDEGAWAKQDDRDGIDGPSDSDAKDEPEDRSDDDRDFNAGDDEGRKPAKGEGSGAEDDKHDAIKAGDQQTLTGFIEVRHVGDHDITQLVLSASVEVNDPDNGSATSNLVALDSSFSKYEGKRTTLRCALAVNPDGQTASNAATRIHTEGYVQVVNVADANDSAPATSDGADDADDDREDAEDKSLEEIGSGVQDIVGKALDGKDLPFGL